MDVEHLARLVAKSIFNDPDTKFLDYKKIKTPNSLVFRLEFAPESGSRVLFVKMPAEDKDEKQTRNIVKRLERESYINDRVNQAFAGAPGLGTAPMVGFLREVNGLVTNEVRGTSLQDHLSARLRFRSRQRVPELKRLAGLAGKWLKRFHSLDIVEEQNDFRQAISSYCGERLDVLVHTKNSQVSDMQAESLKCSITRWVDEVISDPHIDVILCHNDYSPHNIMVTETGICVLDYGDSSIGLPAFDLACFWHKLEDLKSTLGRGKQGLQAIQNSFLDAYEARFDTNRPDVKLGLTRLVLSKMITLLGEHRSGIYRRFENNYRYKDYLALLESEFDFAWLEKTCPRDR